MTAPSMSSPVARDSELRFERTVPRELAHRRAISEVFVADSAAVAEDEFVAAIQVPRAHSLWHDHRHAFHDPMLIVEACRQAAFVGSHRYLGVPVGTRGSLQWIAFQVEDLEAYRDDREHPLEGVVRLRVSDRQEREGMLDAMTFDAELRIGGGVAMSMGGRIYFMPADDFAVLRAHQRARKPLLAAAPPPGPAIDPALIGRCDPRNAVIGDVAPGTPTTVQQRYPVLVDPANPAFFDHAQDHIPGPLIVEVYRQAAIRTATRAGAFATPHAVATRCRATFADFGEYEASTECAAALGRTTGTGRITVNLSLHQVGIEFAEAELELTEVSES
jgi:hypothetical protein